MAILLIYVYIVTNEIMCMYTIKKIYTKCYKNKGKLHKSRLINMCVSILDISFLILWFSHRKLYFYIKLSHLLDNRSLAFKLAGYLFIYYFFFFCHFLVRLQC